MTATNYQLRPWPVMVGPFDVRDGAHIKIAAEAGDIQSALAALWRAEVSAVRSLMAVMYAYDVPWVETMGHLSQSPAWTDVR